jgi:hypothetical protein
LKQYSNTAIQATTPPSDLGGRALAAAFFASSIFGIGEPVLVPCGVESLVLGAEIDGIIGPEVDVEAF